MEMFGEKKFRIAVFIFLAIVAVGLMLSYGAINQGKTISQILASWVNWFFVLLIVGMIYLLGYIGATIWRQTEIRDEIEKQNLIKVEIENLKLIKDLGYEINPEKLSAQTKMLIKENKSTTKSDKSQPSVNPKT